MAKRGPGYPVIGLKEAVARAGELYNQDGAATTSPGVAVGAWGYSSLNGASLRVLAALKYYGILAGDKDSVQLTQRGLTIVLEPEDSQERAEAIHAASEEPTMFSALREQYGENLPSDPAIVSYLVRTHGFGNGAANLLVGAFRETDEFAKSFQVSHIPSLKGEGERERVKDRVDPSRFERPDPKDHKGGAMEFTWPLSGDAVATLTVTRALDVEDIQTLTDYFEIAKRALNKAAAKTAAKQANKGVEELL